MGARERIGDASGRLRRSDPAMASIRDDAQPSGRGARKAWPLRNSRSRSKQAEAHAMVLVLGIGADLRERAEQPDSKGRHGTSRVAQGRGGAHGSRTDLPFGPAGS